MTLFQVGVSVDTLRDFSEEQAASVAAKQGPGLMTAHGFLEALPEPWRIERPHNLGVPSPGPSGARRAVACFDQVRTMFRTGQFGNGLSSKDSPGGTNCER